MWKVCTAFVDCEDSEGAKRCTRFDNPNWSQVAAIIESYGDERRLSIGIDGPKGYTMFTEGFRNDFILTTIGDDMGPYELLGPDSSDQTKPILVGGVLTDLPRKFVATRNDALKAISYFFSHGKLDPDLNWHLD
jgi:hypothetical protein